MKSKKLLATILSVAMLSTTFLGACGNKNNQAETKKNNTKNEVSQKETEEKEEKSDDGKPEMDDVQEYTYVISSAINTLDPARSGSTPNWAAQAPLYEGLTRYVATEDGGAKVLPGVAESWVVSDDGMTYTFNLRKDAKWSDGSDLTAKDFQYTFRRIFDPEVASDYSWLIDGLIKGGHEYLNGEGSREDVGATATDDYTFEIQLTRPCGYFLNLTAFPTHKPVKKEAIEKYGEEYGASEDKVVGNGPFTLAKWEQNVQLQYVPNPNYWNKDNVYLEKVIRKVIQEPAPAAQALLNGEVDSAGMGDPEWRTLLDADGRFDYFSDAGANNEFMMFNCANKYLKNAKIRKAISIAIDREAYIEDISNGFGEPLYSTVPKITSIGQENYSEKVNNENEYLKHLIKEYNPKELFIEGLKELGEDSDPSKVEITINTRGTSEYSKKNAEWFQQKLREAIGFNLKIEMTEWNIMWNKVEAGEYDIALAGWSADYNDPSTFMDCFHTKTGYYGGKKTGWEGESADKFNELLEKAQNSKDNDERAKFFMEAEKLMLGEGVIAPIYAGQSSSYRGKYVKNSYRNPFVYSDFVGVYMSGKK